MIIEECINCGACAVECPAKAIYRPGESWEENGKRFSPISNEHFFIAPSKCDGCSGFDKIKCIAICPMEAIKKL